MAAREVYIVGLITIHKIRPVRNRKAGVRDPGI